MSGASSAARCSRLIIRSVRSTRRTGLGPRTPCSTSDAGGATTEVAALWLLFSGVAILLTARSAVRATLGALLMTTAVQLFIRLTTGPHLALSILAAWLQVTVALTGAFLIVNERAVRDR